MFIGSITKKIRLLYAYGLKRKFLPRGPRKFIWYRKKYPKIALHGSFFFAILLYNHFFANLEKIRQNQIIRDKKVLRKYSQSNFYVIYILSQILFFLKQNLFEIIFGRYSNFIFWLINFFSTVSLTSGHRSRRDLFFQNTKFIFELFFGDKTFFWHFMRAKILFFSVNPPSNKIFFLGIFQVYFGKWNLFLPGFSSNIFFFGE